jgi:hypothetical protein
MSRNVMKLPDPGRYSIARKGHAGTPGAGRHGESCQTCLHIVYGAKGATSCKLMETDRRGLAGVRAKDPACQRWTTAQMSK